MTRTSARGIAISQGKRRHGASLRGAKTPEYQTWCSVHGRCTNPNHTSYPNYGARGVTISAEWCGPGGFERFFAHIGQRPTPKHSIDRIDSKRGYEPGNVRWATMPEQQRNRSSNHVIEANGERLCLQDWAARLGMSHTSLIGRIERGWEPARAVTTPPRVSCRHA